MRISDWSSDVCSSDLLVSRCRYRNAESFFLAIEEQLFSDTSDLLYQTGIVAQLALTSHLLDVGFDDRWCAVLRSEEHTSELQSLMRISYAVFCLKKKNTHNYPYVLIRTDSSTIKRQLYIHQPSYHNVNYIIAFITCYNNYCTT